MADGDLINWQLLAHVTAAAGGPTRGVPGDPADGEALGLLADLECLSAEERLERLAADIQAALGDLPVEEAPPRSPGRGDVQPIAQDTDLRGVQRGDDRGRHGGPRCMPELRLDSTRSDLPPRLKGAFFFETVFGCNDCHLDSCEYCGHMRANCTDRWCHTCFFFKRSTRMDQSYGT